MKFTFQSEILKPNSHFMRIEWGRREYIYLIIRSMEQLSSQLLREGLNDNQRKRFVVTTCPFRKQNIVIDKHKNLFLLLLSLDGFFFGSAICKMRRFFLYLYKSRKNPLAVGIKLKMILGQKISGSDSLSLSLSLSLLLRFHSPPPSLINYQNYFLDQTIFLNQQLFKNSKQKFVFVCVK